VPRDESHERCEKNRRDDCQQGCEAHFTAPG